MRNEIIEQLKKQISGIPDGAVAETVGEVTAVGDGVAEISGLQNVMYAELIEFEPDSKKSQKTLGMALNLEEGNVKAIILGESANIKEGCAVKATGNILSLPVSPKLKGRVIDPLGRIKDGGGEIEDKETKRYPLEKTAPGVITRKSVKAPLHTGVKAIDAMIPIGRGQRELIIGDRGIGKTAIAIDTIINQQKDTSRPLPVCIYVAIGQKESKIAQTVEKLKKAGAMDYTIVISASASESAALQFLAPYAGAAIGEYFMDQGGDALVVYDDLSKHAWAYREVSLLLRRPPGREAYPGDIFYLHSRLLERAANRDPKYGGGSLTALPIIETQLGDLSAYIPTNVISITDGQIYLEPELFYQGIRPAVNVGLSVSRVGSSAQTKAMKSVAGTIRLELAQFRELQAFAQFGQELDPSTKQKIERGRRLTELLKQDENKTVPFEEQVVAIFAAVNGFMDDIAIEKIRLFETDLLKHVKSSADKLLAEIKKTGEISKESLERLRSVISEFTKSRE